MTTARRRGSSPTATAVDAGTPSRRSWWSPLPLAATVFASLGVLLGGPGVAIGPVNGTTAARVLFVAVIVACLVHEVARVLTGRRPARRPEPPTPGADEDRASDLIAVVSHELRTPLTSMIGLMSTVQRGAGRLPPERLAEVAEMACEQGWRLERLVDDVLQGPRDSGDLRPDCRDAVVTVQGAVAALPTGDHDIVLALPDTPVPRCLDHDVLVRIINNLVGNALKYTPAGSRITIAMRPVPTGLELAVADDGPGMSSEAQARAFDKYWRGTAGGKGLGLGLYLVRLLAAAHGGTVTLEESAAGGCRFLVRLEELAASAPAPALVR